MRKSMLAALAAGLAFSVVPASGTEPPGREEQWVQGQVLLPTRFTDLEGGWPGLARRAWLCSAATNGTIGYIFNVFEETWGGMFVIDEVDDQTGEANIQVYFYEEFGDCGGQADPLTTGECASDQPGEVGFVPERTTKAVVFMPTGLDATFLNRGFSPPRIRLGQDALDISVVQGALIRWVNTTGDFAYVRASDGRLRLQPGAGHRDPGRRGVGAHLHPERHDPVRDAGGGGRDHGGAEPRRPVAQATRDGRVVRPSGFLRRAAAGTYRDSPSQGGDSA